MLRDRERATAHAAALAGALQTSGLSLVLHAPDELSVGTPGHDRAMTGLMHYAAHAGAELVVYHGLNFAPRRSLPLRDLDRAWLEERSLERFAVLAQRHEVVIAIENLAPVYPSRPRLSHDAAAVHDLVVRLCSPWIRTCLDLGHAHVTAERAGLDLRAVIEPLLEPVALFHVHDNLGARARDERVPGTDPLRLDLHLAPGAGTLPWEAVGDLVVGHRAPLLLEVHPPHRARAAQPRARDDRAARGGRPRRAPLRRVPSLSTCRRPACRILRRGRRSSSGWPPPDTAARDQG